MNNWEDYPNHRLIKKHELGFYIIKPKDDEEVMPISCPVCSALMKTSDDEAAFNRHKCCAFCALKWADARSESWALGWRPTREEIEIAVSERPPVYLFNV